MRVRADHFEIPADDPARAAAFYRRAFGWRADRVEWSGPAYFKMRSEQAGGAPPRAGLQGGVTARASAGFESPLLVLRVDEASLEECLRGIVAAGGAVEAEPHAIGSMGRFATFRDSEGNLVGLWQE